MKTSLLRAVRAGTVGLVVVLALAGCGSGTGTATTSSATSSDDAAAATSSDDAAATTSSDDAAAGSPSDSPGGSAAASDQADLTPDPSDIGKRVTSPVAAVKDCWKRSADDTYDKVDCTEAHTTEVLAVTNLTLKMYQAAQKTAKKKQQPSAWAITVALNLCRKQYSPKRLAASVKESSTSISYIWPTSVTTDPNSWGDTSQAVCLVNLTNARTTTHKILR